MIKSFKNKGSEDVYDGLKSKAALKCLPVYLHSQTQDMLDLLDRTKALQNLMLPPGNHFKALKGDLKGFYSLRINAQFRIIFRWVDGNAYDVEICDYH